MNIKVSLFILKACLKSSPGNVNSIILCSKDLGMEFDELKYRNERM